MQHIIQTCRKWRRRSRASFKQTDWTSRELQYLRQARGNWIWIRVCSTYLRGGSSTCSTWLPCMCRSSRSLRNLQWKKARWSRQIPWARVAKTAFLSIAIIWASTWSNYRSHQQMQWPPIGSICRHRARITRSQPYQSSNKQGKKHTPSQMAQTRI